MPARWTSQVPLVRSILCCFPNFTQLVENLDLRCCLLPSMRLSTRRVCQKLEQLCSFDLRTMKVMYFLEDGQIWMHCPQQDYQIEPPDYTPQTLTFKFVPWRTQLEAALSDESGSQGGSEEGNDSSSDSEEEQKACRRFKERKIKSVIRKVLRWRELYAGSSSQPSVPLEEGALRVGISKKTLDDYLCQLKKGRKYNFNFNEHRNKKIGVLRSFIRSIESGGKNKL